MLKFLGFADVHEQYKIEARNLINTFLTTNNEEEFLKTMNILKSKREIWKRV